MRVLYLGRIGIWRCWFLSREETGEPGKKPRSKPSTNNKLDTHMEPGCNQTRATLVEGKHSHHCAILALTTNRKGSSSLPFNSATDSATASRGGGSIALFKNSPMSPSLRSLMVRASSWRGVRRISGVACSASLWQIKSDCKRVSSYLS